jgi:hypothetical protein
MIWWQKPHHHHLEQTHLRFLEEEKQNTASLAIASELGKNHVIKTVLGCVVYL